MNRILLLVSLVFLTLVPMARLAAQQDSGHVFHHSSLVGGEEVAAAGEIEVIDGRLELINDRSGYFRIGRVSMCRF